MSRKALVIAVVLIAVAMLATPLVGLAKAGQGQEKLDFVLHLEGLPDTAVSDRSWVAGSTSHNRGAAWNVWKDAYVYIGEDGAVEMITKAYLSYDCELDSNRNVKAGFFILGARETITIWEDTAQTVRRGTLELLSLSNNPAGSGANFVGFGTGEFEGVKVQGISAPLAIIPDPNPIPPSPYLLSLYREGTVMGWPTP